MSISCSGYVSTALHTAASICNVFNNECASYPGSFLRKGAWVRGYVCPELSVSFCPPIVLLFLVNVASRVTHFVRGGGLRGLRIDGREGRGWKIWKGRVPKWEREGEWEELDGKRNMFQTVNIIWECNCHCFNVLDVKPYTAVWPTRRLKYCGWSCDPLLECWQKRSRLGTMGWVC